MALRLEAKTHADHVRLVCTGTYALADAIALYAEAFEITARAGRDAVLIDVRQITGREPGLTDRYDQAVAVAEFQAARLPRIRVAILGHEPMVHPERFGEIVAQNRGAQVRVFTDESAALAWLLPPTRMP